MINPDFVNNIAMSLTVLLYVGLVIYCALKVVKAIELKRQEDILDESAKSQRLVNQKELLYLEKMRLENEVFETLTLYEIMREIAQGLSEKEAFEIFEKKLKDHIDFAECLFIQPLSDEINKYKKSSDCFIFTLRGKRSKLGYLIVKGLSDEHKEKLTILGHQFALALRRIKLYEEIERIAITDSLTELHTRRYTMERLEEELKRSKAKEAKLSLIMIDVDHFKKFNDQYGHLMGDQILKEVGRIVRENIREIDIAGRFGGEEFCVILPDTDHTGVRFAAERIRLAVESSSIEAYDAKVKATASLGAATYPKDGVEIEELIDKADLALYKAKKDGRNRVCASQNEMMP